MVNKMKKEKTSWKKALLLGLFIALIFWAIDLASHELGGTETIFYHVSKIINAYILSVIIVRFFWDKAKDSWKWRVAFSIAMGLWISIYYGSTSYYTGFVQSLGIVALRSPPTFFLMSPNLWGPAHMLYYWIGLNLGVMLDKSLQGGKKQ